MRVKATIFLVQDMHGNKDYAVVGDTSDTVQINGMRDQDGMLLHFESEAYHLKSWCKENGISCREIVRQYDFYTLWEAY